ncbi:lipoprotein [Streptomyces roseoviolaceus]
MARRALTTTAAAFAATAALLLTACGGGDDSSSDDTKRADSEPSSPSASASSAAPGVKRPVIKLPSSFQLTFENWTSSDPVEQAVLNDGKEQLRAGYEAIIENDPDSKDRAFYDTKNGFLQSRQWIRTYTDKNLTVIGKLPVFDPKVTLAKDKAAASLSYCTDESKASTRNRKTGEVKGNPAGTDPEVLYVISMGKNAQGVWQAVSAHSERGGCAQ